ncbi:MAG: hypothetical protein VX597_04830 [Pseudomonadota bacterium]|nr:hypothetical protein [Pseudomonadota bacterium]
MLKKNTRLSKLESFLRKIKIERREAETKLIDLQREINELREIIHKINKEIENNKNQQIHSGYLIQKRIKYFNILHEQREIAVNRIEFLEDEIRNSQIDLLAKQHKENLLLEKASGFQTIEA